MFWKKKQTETKATEAKPQEAKKLSPKEIMGNQIEQLGAGLLAPGDLWGRVGRRGGEP